jgi:MFS family permease
MTRGLLGSAAELILTALAPGAWTIAVALALMQAVSAGALYSAAFTAIAQAVRSKAQASN